MDEWTPEAVVILLTTAASLITNVVQAFQKRSVKADAEDAMLTLARSLSREVGGFDGLERAKREAVKASTRRGSERAIDATMEVVLSESQKSTLGL